MKGEGLENKATLAFDNKIRLCSLRAIHNSLLINVPWWVSNLRIKLIRVHPVVVFIRRRAKWQFSRIFASSHFFAEIFNFLNKVRTSSEKNLETHPKFLTLPSSIVAIFWVPLFLSSTRSNKQSNSLLVASAVEWYRGYPCCIQAEVFKYNAWSHWMSHNYIP